MKLCYYVCMVFFLILENIMFGHTLLIDSQITWLNILKYTIMFPKWNAEGMLMETLTIRIIPNSSQINLLNIIIII